MDTLPDAIIDKIVQFVYYYKDKVALSQVNKYFNHNYRFPQNTLKIIKKKIIHTICQVKKVFLYQSSLTNKQLVVYDTIWNNILKIRIETKKAHPKNSYKLHTKNYIIPAPYN